MELVSTDAGLLAFAPLVLMFYMFARSVPFGALSLPCMTALTSFIYYFLMPALSLNGSSQGHFGMFVTTMQWAHISVFLYAVGAFAAFVTFQRTLAVNPASQKGEERSFNLTIFGLLWAMAITALLAQAALGRLNITASETYEYVQSEGDLAFINLFFSMIAPLTLVTLIRDNFRLRSWALLIVAAFIFLQVGFRYRLIILLSAVVASFLLVRRIKIRISYVLASIFVALPLINLVGASRQYGRGIDLSVVADMSWEELLSAFGGEIGIVYVLAYTADNPLPPLATFDPWIVGIARLVPSFLWADKPTPDYMRHIVAGFWAEDVDKAGVAAPQQVEMLLQFGWFGLPLLAFLYFSVACYLVYRLNKLGREARIAGCAMVPAFFGYYMQTRGYFFQLLSDGLFFFGPLFLMHLWEKRPATGRAGFTRPKPRGIWMRPK